MSDKHRIVAALIALVSGWAASCATPAWAQNYPVRPIRLVIGLPAGGSTDVMGRIVSAKLSERLGQQVVVDNRPVRAASSASSSSSIRSPTATP